MNNSLLRRFKHIVFYVTISPDVESNISLSLYSTNIVQPLNFFLCSFPRNDVCVWWKNENCLKFCLNKRLEYCFESNTVFSAYSGYNHRRLNWYRSCTQRNENNKNNDNSNKVDKINQVWKTIILYTVIINYTV